MRRHAVRITRLVGGSLLLAIGVVGGFIPVLQGWIFILAGLSVMAPESEYARRALQWAKKKVSRDRRGGAESDGPSSP